MEKYRVKETTRVGGLQATNGTVVDFRVLEGDIIEGKVQNIQDKLTNGFIDALLFTVRNPVYLNRHEEWKWLNSNETVTLRIPLTKLEKAETAKEVSAVSMKEGGKPEIKVPIVNTNAIGVSSKTMNIGYWILGGLATVAAIFGIYKLATHKKA